MTFKWQLSASPTASRSLDKRSKKSSISKPLNAVASASDSTAHPPRPQSPKLFRRISDIISSFPSPRQTTFSEEDILIPSGTDLLIPYPPTLDLPILSVSDNSPPPLAPPKSPSISKSQQQIRTNAPSRNGTNHNRTLSSELISDGGEEYTSFPAYSSPSIIVSLLETLCSGTARPSSTDTERTEITTKGSQRRSLTTVQQRDTLNMPRSPSSTGIRRGKARVELERAPHARPAGRRIHNLHQETNKRYELSHCTLLSEHNVMGDEHHRAYLPRARPASTSWRQHEQEFNHQSRSQVRKIERDQLRAATTSPILVRIRHATTVVCQRISAIAMPGPRPTSAQGSFRLSPGSGVGPGSEKTPFVSRKISPTLPGDKIEWFKSEEDCTQTSPMGEFRSNPTAPVSPFIAQYVVPGPSKEPTLRLRGGDGRKRVRVSKILWFLAGGMGTPPKVWLPIRPNKKMRKASEGEGVDKKVKRSKESKGVRFGGKKSAREKNTKSRLKSRKQTWQDLVLGSLRPKKRRRQIRMLNDLNN